MIYLISPYTHPELKVRTRRTKLAAAAVARCAQQGLFVISPVVHGHTVDMENNNRRLPLIPVSYWLEFGIRMLDASEEAFVLTLDGWKESVGCRGEIERCQDQGKALTYFDFNMRKLNASPT